MKDTLLYVLLLEVVVCGYGVWVDHRMVSPRVSRFEGNYRERSVQEASLVPTKISAAARKVAAAPAAPAITK